MKIKIFILIIMVSVNIFPASKLDFHQKYFIITNVLDLATTVYGLQKDLADETNLIGKNFQKKIPLIILCKTGLFFAEFYLLKELKRRNKTLYHILSVTLNGFGTWVVYNNFKVIDIKIRF